MSYFWNCSPPNHKIAYKCKSYGLVFVFSPTTFSLKVLQGTCCILLGLDTAFHCKLYFNGFASNWSCIDIKHGCPCTWGTWRPVTQLHRWCLCFYRGHTFSCTYGLAPIWDIIPRFVNIKKKWNISSLLSFQMPPI